MNHLDFLSVIEVTGQKLSINPALLPMRFSADDPLLKWLYSFIREKTGRVPSSSSVIAMAEQKDGFFQISKEREYDKADIDGVSYCVMGGESPIADLDSQTEEEYCRIDDRKGRAAPREFGSLFPFEIYAMTSRTADVFEDEKIVGFVRRSLLFDKPTAASRTLFQLWSNLRMPPCLLPLKGNDGMLTEVDNLENPVEYMDRPRYAGRGVHYDDGAYHVPELKFRSSEVAKLGVFDLALTRERTGATLSVAFRKAIVSRRVRDLLRRLKVPGLSYVPVRLVD